MANSNDTISTRPENQDDLYILNPNHPGISNRDSLLDEIFLNISKAQSLIFLMAEQLGDVPPRHGAVIDTLWVSYDHLEKIKQVADKISFLPKPEEV